MTTRFGLLIALVFVAGVTAASAQTARTGTLMRAKLLHSQRILAALTTSDYALLQRETAALSTITQSPTWTELITADLRPFTGDFTKALANLSAAAARRDYDASTAAYSAVTTACFNCHKHVMRSRVARAP